MNRKITKKTTLLAILLIAFILIQIPSVSSSSTDDDVEVGLTLTGPYIKYTIPRNNSVNVNINTKITGYFNTELNESTLNSSTFILKSSSDNITGTITYDNSSKAVIFTPSSSLAYLKTYTATLTNEIKDIHGTNLIENYTWQFTTQKEEDDEILYGFPPQGLMPPPEGWNETEEEIEEVEDIEVSLNLSEIYLKMVPGRELELEIEIKRVGGEEVLFGELVYEIKDPSGKIIHSENEEIAIEEYANFMKKMRIPLTAEPGTYTITAELTTDRFSKLATKEFEVIRSRRVSKTKYIYLIIAILTATGITIFFKRKEIKKLIEKYKK